MTLQLPEATIKRWRSVGALALAALLVWCLLVPWLSTLAARLPDTLQKEYLALAALAYIVIAALRKPGSISWTAWLGIKHFFRHPPVWVASLIAVYVAVPVAALSGPKVQHALMLSDSAGTLTDIAIMEIASLVALAVAAYPVPKPILLMAENHDDARAGGHMVMQGPARDTRHIATPLTSIGAMKAWLDSDRPVAHPEDDCFGHVDIARRILQRLAYASGSPSTAVVGVVGSGKTTVRTLCEYYAATAPTPTRIKITPLSLWAFESAEAAVLSTLASLVKSLRTEISTLEMRTLPGDYLRIVAERMPGWGPALFSALRPDLSPEVLLAQVDEMASAVSVHLVLWVEDLERFVESDRAASNQVEMLYSVFYHLDSLDSISVIIASTRMNIRFDREKLARHYEPILPLTPPMVGSVIETFRRHCLDEMEKDEIIDTVQRRHSQISFTSPRSKALIEISTLITANLAHESVSPLTSRSVGETLPLLIKTPRTLKSSLRACMEKWEHLRGEIDFDDILTLCIISHVSPGIGTVFVEFINAGSWKGGVRDSRRVFKNSIEMLNCSEEESQGAYAVAELLFYKYNAYSRPQGVIRTEGKYWARYNTGDLGNVVPRDQALLQLAHSGDPSKHLQVFDVPGGACFTGHFTARDIIGSIEAEIINAIRNSTCGQRLGAISALCYERRGVESLALALHDQVYWGIEEGLAHQNLALVRELMAFFVHRGQADILVHGECIEHMLEKELVRRCSQPGYIVAGARGMRADWQLFMLFFRSYLASTGERVDLPQPEGWSAVAQALLTASSLSPVIVLPQLARFCVDGSPDSPTYLPDRVKALFDSEQLLRVFSRSALESGDRTPAYDVVKKYAAQHLI